MDGIHSITNLKVSNFKEDDDKFFRIGTTYSQKSLQYQEIIRISLRMQECCLEMQLLTETFSGYPTLVLMSPVKNAGSKLTMKDSAGNVTKKLLRRKRNFRKPYIKKLKSNLMWRMGAMRRYLVSVN